MRPERGIDSHRNAKHEREQRRYGCELDRSRESLADQVDDRPFELIGYAEVEMQRVPDEAHELHQHGIVQAERLAQLLTLLEAGLESNHLVDRVADEAEQRKRDQGHDQHDQHGFERPADHEGEHGILPSRGGWPTLNLS